MKLKPYYLQPAEEMLKGIEQQARKRRVTKPKEKIYFITEKLQEKLDHALDSLPERNELNDLQQEFLELSAGSDCVKKSVLALNSVRKALKKISINAKRKARRESDERKALNEFFGRIYSLKKKLRRAVKAFNEVQKQLIKLPSINTEKFTVILAGMPNTGKTTMLYRLTGSKAKIASYAFTTTSINIGFIITPLDEIQVIDCPGLLEANEGKQTGIEKKAKAALKHLTAIVLFIVDPTESLGNNLESQKILLHELRQEFKDKKFIAVINKQDIASKEEVIRAGKAFNAGISDGIGLNAKNVLRAVLEEFKTSLKEKICEESKLLA